MDNSGVEEKMKRVAICFWGQTRTFRCLEECYKKLLESENIQFDFFVSTWDDFKGKENFDFCVGKEFVNPEVLFNRDSVEFMNHTDKASYLIYRVNSLKTQHEIENNFIYDYVMWTRSEIFFPPFLLAGLINEKLKKHKEFEINSHNQEIGVDDDGFAHIAGDYFFLGTSAVFDLYATGWKMYHKRRHSWEIGRHGGHNYHAWVIDNLPIEHIPVKIQHEFLFPKFVKKAVESTYKHMDGETLDRMERDSG